MIGDALYGLTPKELRSQPVMQRAIRQAEVSLAATTVTANLDSVPLELLFHVTHLNVFCFGGGAQTVTSFRVELQDENGVTIAEVWRSTPDGAAVGQRGDAKMVDLLLMPRERLSLSGFFSAGAAVNLVALDAFGLFVPRGNVQHR